MCVEDGSLGFPDPEPPPNDNLDVPYFLHLIAAVRWLCVERSLHARFVRASCALHARAIRSVRQQHAAHSLTFVNTCALYAPCVRTAYVQRASNTLCMRCQLASFFKILTKVQRTTTDWPYFSFFYARTVRRIGVTGPLTGLRACVLMYLVLVLHEYSRISHGPLCRYLAYTAVKLDILTRFIG